MEQKVAVPPDVDQVTIHIEKPAPQTERLTLRKAIMMLPVDVPLDLVVKDGGVLKDGRRVERLWKTGFVPETSDPSRVDQCRQDRIECLSICTLCDTRVLLDEREAVVKVGTNLVGKAYVEVVVEANPKQ
jgi:hypothetical protein